MDTLFESISRRLSKDWRSRNVPRHGHSYRCQCGRPVFFRNSQCLACGAALGYEPELGEVRTLLADESGHWTLAGAKGDAPRIFRRCANFDSPAGCNWLIPVDDPNPHCRSCRLNRTIPDLADPDNQRYWRSIEMAKRRLVAQLLSLELPVESKNEDPERGIAFDLLRSVPGGHQVVTGHSGGLITLNIEEADDAKREVIRNELREPYRTLLGHFRHEIGHYYWDRLIAGTHWHEPFRELFGDERTGYEAALLSNYQYGPPSNWADRFISPYASAHPWEDWAETWAHYLHLYDSLDTALGFGLTADDVEIELEPFERADLYDPDHKDAERFLTLVKSSLELITVLNELSHSLGQPDIYPFVMSRAVIRKLHFIHLAVIDATTTAESR